MTCYMTLGKISALNNISTIIRYYIYLMHVRFISSKICVWILWCVTCWWEPLETGTLGFNASANACWSVYDLRDLDSVLCSWEQVQEFTYMFGFGSAWGGLECFSGLG